MAADTECDCNGLKTRCQKIFEKGGDIVGFAGDTQDGMLFVEWYGSDEDRPEMGEDFEGLVLTKDNKIFYYGRRCVAEEIFEPYFSIGAGSHVAASYMDNGSTPAQAVYAACMKTIGSGPPVDILRL